MGGPVLAVSVVIPLGQVIEWDRFPVPLQFEGRSTLISQLLGILPYLSYKQCYA